MRQFRKPIDSGARFIRRLFLIALSISLVSSYVVFGQASAEPRPVAPPTAPGEHPLLAQLNQETRQLFGEVRPSVVRVQLPVPRWTNDYALRSLDRWQKLDPEVRSRLSQDRPTVLRGESVRAGARDATPPSPQADGNLSSNTIYVNPVAVAPDARPRDAVLGATLRPTTRPSNAFTPNNVGLILDEHGHILVPLYVGAEDCANTQLRIATQEGDVIEVRFVGSDRQTNLTLLQSEKPAGKPASLGSQRPENGTLAMSLSLMDAGGRLILWDGGFRDYGLIFTVDGRLAGVARYGQFLSGSACRLIADQIIRYGSVKRATLGVIVSEIRKDDPLREQLPALGGRAALHVDEVIANSVADKAGLKTGDLLLSLAGEPVSDIPSFAAAIAGSVGETELQVGRNDQVLRISVKLEQK